MTEQVRNIDKALAQIEGPWRPLRLARVNACEMKVAKLYGEFVWHSHPDTDELFLVLKGELTIQLRDGEVLLRPGDVFVVPRGVEHCPKATTEVHAVLFESEGTMNTGDAGGELTAKLRDYDADRVDYEAGR